MAFTAFYSSVVPQRRPGPSLRGQALGESSRESLTPSPIRWMISYGATSDSTSAVGASCSQAFEGSYSTARTINGPQRTQGFLGTSFALLWYLSPASRIINLFCDSLCLIVTPCLIVAPSVL